MEPNDTWIPKTTDLSDEFEAAFFAAVSRDTAVCIRVWLGDVDGMMMEWDSPVVSGVGGVGPGHTRKS